MYTHLQIFIFAVSVSATIINYDSYTGVPLTFEEYNYNIKRNATFWCTTQVFPCNPHEGRRIDGTCNNLRYPTRGASHTPLYRLLSPAFDNGFEPRKTKSGNTMPLPRYLRKRLLSDGYISDQKFTHLALHVWVFMSGDVLSFHDTVNYVLWKPYCCTPKGKTDHACVPNKIPDDDPVHRFSNIKCMNMTRPESFQSVGCLRPDTIPDRILSATPTFDASSVYGNTLTSSLEKGRLFVGGLLKYEIENGKIWPPSTKGPLNLCLLNQKPHETRCHDIPEDGGNSVAGLNLVVIWFWRFHNHVASILGRINPCWDDDRLFYAARDIVIATEMQIILYELLPSFLGKNNLIRDGVMSSSSGFRDMYNEEFIPQISLEFTSVLRWFHTVQPGHIKMYDAKGYYIKKMPIGNLTLRTGLFAVDNHIDYMTQGSFRQAAGKIDHTVDPEMGESSLGPHQKAHDVLTNDIAKNRYFGFQPYVKYVEFCRGLSIKNYDDLLQVMDPERVEMLKEVYEHFEDVDLQGGLWLEKLIEGGHVPATLYCVVVEQMLRTMISDRHWYERENRPNAFTQQQLLEVRKMTIAKLLCDVGDSVTSIQRHAFLKISSSNPLINCHEIEGMDFWAWEDSTCNNDGFYYGPDFKSKNM